MKEFFLELDSLFSGASKRMRSLTVVPTRFGTGCSFTVLKEFPGDVIIALREDQTVFEVAEAILTSVTRYEAYRELLAGWEETEFLVDWPLSKSRLKRVLSRGVMNIKKTVWYS